MDKDYITVKEFVELAGVSQQSIYQRIKKPHNPIQPYLKEINSKTYIRKTALQDLYSNDTRQEERIEPTERILDILEKQLAEKDRQIQEKDNQIKSLLKSLEDTQRLLDQQQQLKAMETKLLTDMKESAATAQEENSESTEIEPEEKSEAIEQKPETKKGFFRRFFGY